MTQYIREVKKGLRDQCGVKPTGGTADEPLFANIPDGQYQMTIEGKLDRVVITGGIISCCNFEK